MGSEGLLALIGYALMAVSVFLPWATFAAPVPYAGITLRSSSSALQVNGGEPGIFLLAMALMGVLGTLFQKKTLGVGLGDSLAGTCMLFLVGYCMNIIVERNASSNSCQTGVACDLGLGGYLALAASFLVIVAGITTVIKSKKRRVQKEDTTVHEKLSDGLRGSFPLDEQTIDEEVSSTKPRSVVATGKRFCVECGDEIPTGSKFCNNCGTKQP